MKKTLAASLIVLGCMSAQMTMAEGKAEEQKLPESISIEVPDSFTGGNNDTWFKIGNAMKSMAIKNWDYKITGYGGSVVEANRFVNSIETAQQQGKKVTMEVIGPSYSAHAMITCYADDLQFGPRGSLMFHSASYVNSIFFGLISYNTSDVDKSMEVVQTDMLAHCVNKGILTAEDVEHILRDGDVYVTKVNGEYQKTYTEDPSRAESAFGGIRDLAILISAILFILIVTKKA